MILPYDVLLNICRFIQSSDDMYSFLKSFNLENLYYDICKYITDYYINELLPNEDIEIFLEITEFAEGAYPDELFPVVDDDTYTVFCSEMVKEYLTQIGPI